jgi:hypothetical protein
LSSEISPFDLSGRYPAETFYEYQGEHTTKISVSTIYPVILAARLFLHFRLESRWEGGGFTHAGRSGHGVATRVGAVVQSEGDRLNPIALLFIPYGKRAVAIVQTPEAHSGGSQRRLAEERMKLMESSRPPASVFLEICRNDLFQLVRSIAEQKSRDLPHCHSRKSPPFPCSR